MTGGGGNGHRTPEELLRECEIAGTGLHHTHPTQNLGLVAAAIRAAFRDDGPLRLGPARRLMVLAVDGLGWYAAAEAGLVAPWSTPLTSEFPSTTVTSMLTAVTGAPAGVHGLVGVHQLHPDGIGTVNCFDGVRDQPSAPAPARPTASPDLPTVFTDVAHLGLATVAYPHELARLHADVVGRLLRGCTTVVSPVAGRSELGEPLPGRVGMLVGELERAVDRAPAGLSWCYVDLDTHAHRYGMDAAYLAAAARLGELAGRLSATGTAVLLFSDHGLAPHAPSRSTRAALAEVAADCRLPPGGAGRVRWLYPRPERADRVADRLARRLPGVHVTDPVRLAQWGLVRAGSIGQRRMGEIVLVAEGPDFPGPDPDASYEHGSMTAPEALVPMLCWPGADG